MSTPRMSPRSSNPRMPQGNYNSRMSQGSYSSPRMSEMSLPSISAFLEKKGYKMGKQIGAGSYSKVKLAYRSGELGYTTVACKVIAKKKASSEFVTKFLPREIDIIRTIRHPNIVSFYHIFELEDQVYVFMEYCDKGDLIDYLLKRGALHEPRARILFRQLVSAVEYLHGRDLAHRDLKCENILLTSGDTLKIADFGFARPCRDSLGRRVLSSTYCGSAAYAAPEILTGISYNPKMTDVWSLGCVLYIMLCALMPFDDEDIKQMLKIQLSRTVHFPARLKISVKAKKFIMHLLEPDVTRRATIKQVAKDPWMTSSLSPVSSSCLTPGGSAPSTMTSIRRLDPTLTPPSSTVAPSERPDSCSRPVITAH